MSDLIGLAEEVIGRAAPGEQVEAYVARSRSTTVHAYGGEVESLAQAVTAGVGIRVVVEGRQGFAYAGSLEPEVLAEALADARDNAAFAAPDDANGVAEPDGVAMPTIDLYRRSLATTPTARKVDLAFELERLALTGDPRVTGIRSAVVSDSVSESVVATTTGLRSTSESTSCHLAVMALASDGDQTQTGYGVRVGRDFDDLDPEAAAREAVEDAVQLLGARQAPSQRLTVVLQPAVTASFLGVIGGTLSGEVVLRGRSLFAERVGEVVAAPDLVLVEDPTEAASPGARHHDGEGLACRRTPLIEAGVLQGFLHDTWSARRAGTGSTASAVRGYSSTPSVGARALALRPGSLDRDELLAEVGDGLLVQGVSGLHSGVNPVSGDFSVGAEGLMIRDGALAEPVREVTIASTLQRMLQDVVAIGADLEWRPGGTGATSLAIAGVSLGGA